MQKLNKGEFDTNYEKMLAKRNRLEQEINSLDAKIASLPMGTLYPVSAGKYHKWYQYTPQKEIYISKKNPTLLKQLATKKYLSFLLQDLKHEKAAIELYLQHYQKYPPIAETLLLEDSPYSEILFKNKKKKHVTKEEVKLDNKENHPENLIHKSVTGNVVRSKSEALIDMLLSTHNLNYFYEQELKLGEIIVKPDFTIIHPKTGESYYWEHFGLIDNKNYLNGVYHKLGLYIENDIIPSINLITTYETKEHPLDSKMIEKTIQCYFE